MAQIKTVLQFVRSTKNTHVYQSADDKAPVKQQYIEKSAFEGEAPKQIEITVSVPS